MLTYPGFRGECPHIDRRVAPNAECAICNYRKADNGERRRRADAVDKIIVEAFADERRSRTGVELRDTVHTWYTEMFGTDATDGRENINPNVNAG